jgi:hypothetical protein
LKTSLFQNQAGDELRIAARIPATGSPSSQQTYFFRSTGTPSPSYFTRFLALLRFRLLPDESATDDLAPVDGIEGVDEIAALDRVDAISRWRSQLDHLSAATKVGKLVDPHDWVTAGIDEPGSRTT